MTTVQIVGIAIAVTIVAVLVISLVVTRRKDREMEAAERPATPPITSETGAFLDEQPRDELELLGESESGTSAAETDLPPTPAGIVAEVEEVRAAPAALEQMPVIEERGPAVEELAPSAGERPVVEEPSVFAVVEPVAALEPAPQSPGESQPTEPAVAGEERLVALSDIIVTTNQQQIDLSDPDVRRMLKELVKDEIDLAIQYRDAGQNVDAVLQLTEAERVCTALGMTSHARLIRDMIRDLEA